MSEWKDCCILYTPEPLWEWDLFGNENIKVNLTKEVSWLARFAFKVVLGSKWNRITK